MKSNKKGTPLEIRVEWESWPHLLLPSLSVEPVTSSPLQETRRPFYQLHHRDHGQMACSEGDNRPDFP